MAYLEAISSPLVWNEIVLSANLRQDRRRSSRHERADDTSEKMNQIDSKPNHCANLVGLCGERLVVERIALQQLVSEGADAHDEGERCTDLDGFEGFIVFFEENVDFRFPFIDGSITVLGIIWDGIVELFVDLRLVLAYNIMSMSCKVLTKTITRLTKLPKLFLSSLLLQSINDFQSKSVSEVSTVPVSPCCKLSFQNIHTRTSTQEVVAEYIRWNLLYMSA
jgi:hypothetical protein